MTLTRAAFARAVSTLPGVTLHEQWDSLVAKVGGKVFALVGADGGSIVFKVSRPPSPASPASRASARPPISPRASG